ncbi:hypothetical protein [Legionella feeleii]|uniref:Uncharacterized protein n=1 Tax=Legionella feeleii TaxID=453 RepID=A0A378ISW2_9GAMM|nr:hypothetical protein [Legionella feeleii]STX37665.1 Uncharacterised protein [Legionella feeleii]
MGLLSFFQNVKICQGQKTPDTEKNFFQNYSDHFAFLEKEFKKKGAKLMEMNFDDGLSFLSDQALERLKLFERLRDGHDYFDEVVGATAIPLMSLAVATVAAAAAIWEGVQDLAIHTGYMKAKDKVSVDENLDTSLYLMIAGSFFLLAVASFLKSAISLISRPVVTAIQGFDEQDKERFCNNDSVAGKVMGVFGK